MLPPATVPGAAGGVTPPDAAARDGREQRAPRDAATGRAEVMAMPAIWKDAAGRLTELPGAGGGIVACGALPGAAAPGPAWTADQLAAAGIAGEPRPVREGTGLGLASAVLTPALLDAALAGLPGRRSRKITPRLAVQIELARALMPGTAAGTLRTLAQRPREADPVYDLPASSSLSDADSFLGVRPLVNLLAGLCGQVRAVPLPGLAAVCLPAAGTPGGQRTAVRLRPLAGGPWSGGRWHGLRVLAKDGTVRNVADPKGSDRKGTGGQSRNAAHFGRPASTGAPADPQIRMVEVTELVYLEEKQTLAGGQPVTAATPAGAYRMAAATVAAHQALRIASAGIAAAIGAEPARISATALRCAVTASIGAGQGATASALSAAIEITRRDITAHPLRLVTAWRPGRHYPRFTIKKVRARKSNDVVPAATRLHLLPLPATPGPQQPNAPPAA